MYASMHVAVQMRLVILHGIDDRLRTLRRGAIIEIGQGPPIDLARQNGKVSAYERHIIGGGHSKASRAAALPN